MLVGVKPRFLRKLITVSIYRTFKGPFVILHRFFPILAAISLAGCFPLEGEPASPNDVARGLIYHSVKYEVVLDGYVERRYTFHRPDGYATFTKQVNTSTGVTRETRVGKWRPAPGQVCYTWKTKNECKKVNKSEGKIVAEHGDVKYRDIGGTQRRNGMNVIEPPEIANAPSLGSVIAKSPIGAALRAYGKAVESVCGSGGCQGQATASKTPIPNSATNRPSAAVKTTGVQAGVKRIENWGTSPNGSSPQFKITCSNGTTHRYWRQGNEWSGPFGSVGLRTWDINRLAKDRCA